MEGSSRPTSPREAAVPTSRIHPSLVRPILIAGVEREVMIPLVGIALFLVFGFRANFVTPTLAALLVFGLLPRLRSICRRDPQSFAVLRRHLRLAGLYRAQGDHDQRRVTTRPSF